MPYSKPHIHCGLSESDYSDRKMIQTDIDHDYFSELTPRNTIIKNNPIVFQIEPSTDFIDPSRTELKLTLSLTDNDGNHIASEPAISPINNIVHSIFSQVSVSLKNTVISHPNANYGYRSYLENLLNFSTESKKTWMTQEGFFMDETDKFDSKTNTGLLTRKTLFADGRKAILCARLHTDLNFQQNLIPSNLDLTYTLTPARQQFVIQSFDTEKTYSINIEAATLLVRKVKLYPERNLSFEKEIFKEPVKIPIQFVKVDAFTIAAGSRSFDKNSLFVGNLPELCILGLVDNESFTGSFSTNPFNFKNYDLSSLHFVCNGKQIPTQSLSPIFATKNVYSAYNSLYTTLNRKFSDWSNGLTISDYIGGSTLYGVNFNSNTFCAHDNGPRQGAIDISIKFASSLPSSTTLIVYSQSQANIIIDKFRNVVMDV